MPPVIGQWVKRNEGKWHLVESVVSDDAITRCGRRLHNEGGILQASEFEPLTRMIGQPQVCKRCGQ